MEGGREERLSNFPTCSPRRVPYKHIHCRRTWGALIWKLLSVFCIWHWWKAALASWETPQSLAEFIGRKLSLSAFVLLTHRRPVNIEKSRTFRKFFGSRRCLPSYYAAGYTEALKFLWDSMGDDDEFWWILLDTRWSHRKQHEAYWTCRHIGQLSFRPKQILLRKLPSSVVCLLKINVTDSDKMCSGSEKNKWDKYTTA